MIEPAWGRSRLSASTIRLVAMQCQKSHYGMRVAEWESLPEYS